MYKKTILVGTMILLLLGVTVLPVSALMTSTEAIKYQETTTIERFMDDAEHIASESQTFGDFIQRVRDLSLTKDYGSYPVIRELFTKILQVIFQNQGIGIAGINLFDLLGSSSSRLSANYFVISYGAYHRLSPRKENSINFFREGFPLWRYSDTARLLKGRTLIFARQPFGIHQKMTGPQIGIMRGFRGIYIDLESKLTGNSYVFFLGGVRRIRAFDLTPFSK
ncbi:hypothetical protein AYK25_04695 [Thermoplasmatales archaeon SM1-50]|nr:MAG: hypothetical protein AYK25_04695 [Thermoplasmatales archaeon SM1-50]